MFKSWESAFKPSKWNDKNTVISACTVSMLPFALITGVLWLLRYLVNFLQIVKQLNSCLHPLLLPLSDFGPYKVC